MSRFWVPFCIKMFKKRKKFSLCNILTDLTYLGCSRHLQIDELCEQKIKKYLYAKNNRFESLVISTFKCASFGKDIRADWLCLKKQNYYSRVYCCTNTHSLKKTITKNKTKVVTTWIYL